MLLRSGRKEAALELFKSSEDSTPSAVSSAVRYEMMATAAYQSSDLRAAVQYQKLAAVEFSKKVSTMVSWSLIRQFGDEDRRTKECNLTLQVMLKETVELVRTPFVIVLDVLGTYEGSAHHIGYESGFSERPHSRQHRHCRRRLWRCLR